MSSASDGDSALVQSDEIEIGWKGEVPDSAVLALEYLLWLLEKAGFKFKHGTALYWNLIHVVMNHISR